MQKTLKNTDWALVPFSIKPASDYQEIGQAKRSKVLPFLAMGTFVLGLFTGVIFTNTIQTEDAEIQRFSAGLAETDVQKTHKHQGEGEFLSGVAVSQPGHRQ